MDAQLCKQALKDGDMHKRLPSDRRRLQILRTATRQFAATGLGATTTAMLAKAAGVSEPVLYTHFGNKDNLFKEVVETNTAMRLTALSESLASLPRHAHVQCAEAMAEATVAACIAVAGNVILTTWALLEAPDHAGDLHQKEIGAVRALWERELAERFPESRERALLRIHLIPRAVNACLAFGHWLAALRHTPDTAASHVHLFATGIGNVAAAILADATPDAAI